MTRKSVRHALFVAATLLFPQLAVFVSAQTLRFTAHKAYSSGYGPAAIAVGDINGDQRPDLAVALAFSDAVTVMLGNADGSFQPPRTVYLGPSQNPRGVAIGDFNRDSRPDVAVANAAANTVSVLLGNGDGTFQPTLTAAAGIGSCSVAVGDFNSDSNPDLVVANTGAGNIALLLGNGDGTFQAARNFIADGGPSSVAVGDFNGDTRVDVAVGNTGSGTISALISNGDGTLQSPRNFAAGAAVSSVAVGDMNGDGRSDLMTSNNAANTVSVLRGNGDGTFQAAQSFAAGNGPTFVAIGDVNRDGRADAAVTSYNANTSSGMHVAVLLGNGDGTLQGARTYSAGYESWAVAIADFNADTSPDLAVANSFSTTISILLGNGDGTFPTGPAYSVGRNPESVVVGDFNRDGVRDLAVANAGSHTLSVLLGNGNGTFQAGLTFATGRGPTSIALGDFNRDGIQDLVTTNYGSSDYYWPIIWTTVSVLIGNGDGTFQAAQNYEAGPGPNSVAVGEFNGDGLQDLAVADYGAYPERANTVSVLLGNGNGTFGAPQAFQVGSAASCVSVGDFNRDGRSDLAACNYNDNNVSILLGNGNGTFQAVGTVPVGAAPWMIVIEDLTGDQIPDLVVTGHWSDIVSVVRGNGDGTFQPHVWYFTGRGPTGLALADLNSDGRRDVVVTNYFSTTVSVLLGNGDGTLQAAQDFGVDLAPMSVAAADFNGDGQPDLATTNYFSFSASVLINNTFAPRVATPTFAPAAGTYVGPQLITITVSTAGATIHYTTNGTAPTTASPVYSGPIPVSGTTTIRAIAVLSGMLDSAEASAAYTIRAFAPGFSPSGGTHVGSATVTLSTATTGGTIRYTTDGSTPTAASAAYSAPLVVSQTTTIRAITTAPGMLDSDVSGATYTIKAVAPAFSPSGGTYVGSVTIALSTPTSGATIRYTTDGSTPTAASAAYSAPLVLSQTTTIRAITTAPGTLDSDVSSATYTVQVVTPTFSVTPGTFNQPQTVALSTATSGATIRYTIDGSTPTATSPAYSGPISVTRTTTIRAMAMKPGMENSTVASATYTLQAATPTFDPPGGSYLLPQVVSISSASPGVTIYYTTDGSTPTTSSTQYTGSFLVGIGTTTVRAIAVASGWSQSAIASATYRIPF